MTITYALEKGLYVNITNKCRNNCDFCIRRTTDNVRDSGSLWLEHEPTSAEILTSILKNDVSKYEELVFCGFGEPTMRLAELLWLCTELKKLKYPLPIRLNTNGQVSLSYGRGVAGMFSCFDVISISMNAKNAQEYVEICHPQDGAAAYQAMLDFASDVKKFVPSVMFTVVDTLPAADIDECRRIADAAGVSLRVRHYVEAY